MLNVIDFKAFKKIISYIRISTGSQETTAQRHAIDKFYSSHQIQETHCIEANGVSSRKRYDKRHIDTLLSTVTRGSLVVVSELSRLARSISEMFDILTAIRIRKGAYIYVINQSLMIKPEADIHSDTMIFALGLSAQVERDLISQRTKAGVRAAWASGKQKGSPTIKKLAAKQTAAAIKRAKELKPIIIPMIKKGHSQARIRDELNALGELTVRGKAWCVPSVQRVLWRLGLRTKYTK